MPPHTARLVLLLEQTLLSNIFFGTSVRRSSGRRAGGRLLAMTWWSLFSSVFSFLGARAPLDLINVKVKVKVKTAKKFWNKLGLSQFQVKVEAVVEVEVKARS